MKRGTVHLEPGVHALTLTYLIPLDSEETLSDSTETARRLHLGFPREFVRSLTVGDIESSIRLMAGALVGSRESPRKRKRLLIKLHRGGWPLSEEEQGYVEQARMRIRRLAGTEVPLNDHGHALELIESSLATYPMLRLDPEFMVSVIAVYASWATRGRPYSPSRCSRQR